MHKNMMRIYEAAKSCGVEGQSNLARELDESPQNIKNWENRGPSRAGIIKAAKRFNCSVSWIDDGVLLIEEDWYRSVTPNKNFSINQVAPESNLALGLTAQPVKSSNEDTLHIPLLNIKASMGTGIDNDCEHVIDMLTICKSWADRTLRPYSNDKNLSFIHAIGDSMAPTFNDGDVLMIYTGDKSIKEDKIYVIEAHGRLFIKRMRQRIDGVFEISSDNPLIKTVDILNGDHEVEIKGRVIWVWNGKKL